MSSFGKCIILVSLMLPIAGGIRFYRNQNRVNRIGGHISKPKTVWLCFALYLYFILPVLSYEVFDDRLNHGTRVSLVLFSVLLYLRALLQPLLMYRLKIWTPILGIAYNLLCSCFLINRYFKVDFQRLTRSDYDVQIDLLLAICLGVLLTDSFYAWSFYKIVGRDTQGEDAIWYASNDNPAFDRINRITFRLNILFIIALVLWFLRMLLL